MKPRIVLDTNVLVSAVLFERGNEARILGYALEGGARPVSSLEILEEYREVLSRPKFKLAPTQILAAFQTVLSLCEIVLEIRKARAECRDPDDQKVLDCATTARANLLVTGDKDLLVMRQVERTRIVSPGKAVKELKQLPILKEPLKVLGREEALPPPRARAGARGKAGIQLVQVGS